MLQGAKKYIGIFILALVVILLGGYLTASLSTKAEEQNQNESIQLLLQSLKARIEDEPGFLIHIKFAVPLMENDEIWWHIPYQSEDGEIVRILGAIGSDYVCFFEQAGSAPANRCTPFSNIVSVTWLEDF